MVFYVFNSGYSLLVYKLYRVTNSPGKHLAFPLVSQSVGVEDTMLGGGPSAHTAASQAVTKDYIHTFNQQYRTDPHEDLTLPQTRVTRMQRNRHNIHSHTSQHRSQNVRIIR